MDGGAGAKSEMAVENDVRDEAAVLAEDDIGADGAPRADGAGCGDFRAGGDDGGGMDGHS